MTDEKRSSIIPVVEKTIIDNIIDENQSRMGISAFESLGGRTVDYRTFFEWVDVYAKAFLEMGVKNGSIVTICTVGTLDTVLYFAGLNKIGAVAQFVNQNYFKVNSQKYIDETGSELLICLDRFYPAIKEAIAKTKVKRILLASISEYASFLFKVLAGRKHVGTADRISGVRYMELPDFLALGRRSTLPLPRIAYEKEKPAVITYTSGTTGNPKGVVHTNDSLNNMMSFYIVGNGFGINEGERNLVLIPPMYMTSFMHSIFAPLYMGATNILQPIYNPNTLGKDLTKYKPKTVVASKAHFIQLENANLKKGSLYHTKYAYCGGEAISKPVAERINRILDYYGIGPMVIGYGQTEFATMTMFNFSIPARTNESGILIPGVEARILDVKTGQPVKTGERGELYIHTPALMKEYLGDPAATARFIITDSDGKKWGRTGDIAAVVYQYDGQDVYEVSGRKSDSFTDENGEIVYLFDLEVQAENVDGVKEAEAIALTVNGRKVPVIHFIPESTGKTETIIRDMQAQFRAYFANPSAIPYAYKPRESFATSPISGKRDYAVLSFEKEGYLRIKENGEIERIRIESKESAKDNELLQSNITV